MGTGGRSYAKNNDRLNKDKLRKKVFGDSGDTYDFDVEYQKLKKEQEKAADAYSNARERYLRITEELRDEMANGTASDSDMAQFMAILSDRGVELQEEQARMQKEIDNLAANRADVADRMNALRRKAFSGATNAALPAAYGNDYKGFKVDSSVRSDARIVEMSPQDYLRRVAYSIRDNTLESMLRTASPSEIQKYMRQMIRGTKFNTPSINYRGGTSSGEEHVLAALMNGYKKIPVMMIE